MNKDNGIFLTNETIDVLYIVSMLATKDGVTQHFPALVAARTPQKAIDGALNRMEELYPRADGWSYSVTDPELFIDLLKAVATFAKEGGGE